mgnify:CR=1 FL=1
MPKFEQDKGFSSMFNKKISNAFPNAIGDSYSPFQQNKKKKNTLEDNKSKLTVDEKGNKFYIDSEGRKHTGQVSDAEYEKRLDDSRKMDLTKKEGLGPRVEKKKLTEKDMQEWQVQENMANQETFSEIVDHKRQTDKNKFKNKFRKKSPAKQEGPIDKKQLKLQPSENKDTDVYKPKKRVNDPGQSFDMAERIADLEDRVSFIKEDASASGKQLSKQQKKDIAKLTQEAQILRKRRGDKTK